ncbi:hypothetical protein [Saliphagus sp. LR7]|uniref:hypothetical protein n=1 Tax=Saliphagus sp. LR7 TaxID=2282654 RepID=UPI000DF862EF|nr:hypothetical protein [Saliphagus sp. LR7]
MKITVPGLPGVSYDTDAESTAISATLTAAGRKAPKPQGYAIQLLPLLWSIDVDLQEAPNEHPIQYLHPEGAHSLDELPTDHRLRRLAREADGALRLVGDVNAETEAAVGELMGHERADGEEWTEIEIEDGDAR